MAGFFRSDLKTAKYGWGQLEGYNGHYVMNLSPAFEDCEPERFLDSALSDDFGGINISIGMLNLYIGHTVIWSEGSTIYLRRFTQNSPTTQFILGKKDWVLRFKSGGNFNGILIETNIEKLFLYRDGNYQRIFFHNKDTGEGTVLTKCP